MFCDDASCSCNHLVFFAKKETDAIYVDLKAVQVPTADLKISSHGLRVRSLADALPMYFSTKSVSVQIFRFPQSGTVL